MNLFPVPSAPHPDSKSRSKYPAVLLVILNYNGWRDTIECIQTLNMLSYTNWHLLLVDNASEDESVKIISSEYPEVEILINERNLGFGAGNNRGMKLALERDYDYVWLLNNDTKVEPNTLTAMVELAERNKQAGAIGSLVYAMNPPECLLAYGGGRFRLAYGFVDHVLHRNGGLNYLTGASMMLRISALRQTGLFDERYFFLWEDVDLSFRMVRSGWQLQVAESSRVWHKDGGTSAPMSLFRMENHAKGLVLTLRKHAKHPRLSSIPMLLCYGYIALRKRSWTFFHRCLRGWRSGWRL